MTKNRTIIDAPRKMLPRLSRTNMGREEWCVTREEPGTPTKSKSLKTFFEAIDLPPVGPFHPLDLNK